MAWPVGLGGLECGLGCGDGADACGEVVGWPLRVEWVTGDEGEGGVDVGPVLVGVLEGAGECVPAGWVGGESRVDAGDSGCPASCVVGGCEAFADLVDLIELGLRYSLGIVGPGSDAMEGDGVSDECGVGVEVCGDQARCVFPGVDGLGGEHGAAGESGGGRGQVGEAFGDERIGQGAGLVEGVNQACGVAFGDELGGVGAVGRAAWRGWSWCGVRIQ